ncbi:MAG: PTS sugar transporter subunit IIA [Anaerostipes sp.]|nr:PTS sugar transporter subunit IIA [Anaerostipes sp.]
MICIEVAEKIEDYKEAIRVSCNILREKCNVEEGYYDSIMENIQNFGGYFYLGEGVCMPHARLKQDIAEASLCMLKVKEPVDFQGEKVYLFFTLAAKDEDSHMNLLKKISQLCSSKEKMQQLMDTNDKQKLLSMM